MSQTSDRSALPASFGIFAEELIRAFRAWRARPAPWSESRLDALARRAFALQYEGNRPFRLYCERLGIGPGDVAGWRGVPGIPTEAFREVTLCVGGARAARELFRTSGTSRGRARRGRHPLVEPELYRASLEAGFARQVLDRDARSLVLSLIPPFAPARESSLSWMAEAVVERFGTPDSRFAAGPGGIDWDAAEALVEEACAGGRPVCILATTLAVDGWMARLERRGIRYRLPPGSRLMDTGGAKGRPGLERAAVVEAVTRSLGLPAERVINEFGMTELLSQRYSRPPRPAAAPAAGSTPEWPEPIPVESETAGAEEAGARGAGTPDPPRLYGPPWLRTRSLDPVTLEELPDGKVGVLCHFDLANAGSVCAVLTEDLGRVRAGAVEWIGRSSGAPPRGCSLATAELLAAQRERG